MTLRRTALCTVFWLALTPVSSLAQPVTTEAVIAAADAALAQAASGDRRGARDALVSLGDGLPEGSPALARAYPYLALARLYRSARNWDLSERMAAGAAQILDAGGYGTHPYRIEALILQGIGLANTDRPEAATLTLRPALAASDAIADQPGLHRLGRYYLAVAASRARAADAGALRAAYRAMHDDLTPLTDGDLLVMDIEGLSLDALDPGAEASALAARSRRLMAEAEASQALSPGNLAEFRALHARLLMNVGALDEAIAALDGLWRAAVDNRRFDTGHIRNATALARALAKRGDLPAGADILARTEAQVTAKPAEDVGDADLALLIALRAGFARAMGDAAASQAAFRRAYGVARRSLGRSEDLVRRIAAEIDVADPGMQGFALADEFQPVAAINLTTDGDPVLRGVLAGDYAAVLKALQAGDAAVGGQTALRVASGAYYAALTGFPGDADAALRRARALAGQPGADLAPDDPFLDLVALTAILFGSTRPATEVQAPLDRLVAQLPDLPPDMALLVTAFRVFALSDTLDANHPRIRALVQDWAQQWAGLTTPSATADFSALMIGPDLFDALGEGPARAILDPLRARHAGQDGLRLLSAQLQFDHLDLTGETENIEDRLAEMAALAAEVSEALPTNHPLNIWNMASVGDALNLMGRFSEGQNWINAALSRLRDRPGHPDDMEAYLLHRIAIAQGGMGRDRDAASSARQAYDLIDPLSARPWVAYPVILGYAIERPRGGGDWYLGAEVIDRFLDNPDFVARIPPDDILYMRFTRTRLIAMSAPPDDALRAVAAFVQLLPDDGQDRRDTRSILAMLQAEALRELDRLEEAWERIKTAADLDRDWRVETYGALAQASGLSTAAQLLSLEAAIGWTRAQALDPD